MPGATSESPHLIKSRLQGAPTGTGKTVRGRVRSYKMVERKMNN